MPPMILFIFAKENEEAGLHNLPFISKLVFRTSETVLSVGSAMSLVDEPSAGLVNSVGIREQSLQNAEARVLPYHCLSLTMFGN